MAEWYYEKLNDDGEYKQAPLHDLNCKITGKCVMNLKEYFDENPEERITLGYIKHIRHKPDELNYDPQTQYIQWGLKENSAYEVEDVLTAVNKSQEMFQLEEIQQAGQRSYFSSSGGIVFS